MPKNTIHLKSLYDQVKYFSENYSVDCDNIYESCLHNAEVARKIRRNDIVQVWENLSKIFTFGDQDIKIQEP